MGRGATAFVAWVATTILASGIFAGYLGRRIEGQIASRGETGLMLASAIVALVSVVLTIRWAAGLGRAEAASTNAAAAPHVMPARRRFLLGLLGLAGGVLATGAATLVPNRRWKTITLDRIRRARPPASPAVPPGAWAGSRIAAQRRLGRTDCRVSDVSLAFAPGTDEPLAEAIAREAIARGVDAFVTWPDGDGGRAQIGLGRAMAGRRDALFVSTGFCLAEGHLPAGSRPEEYMAAVEESLRRLGTERVDLVQIHGCNSIERLLDPRVHEAFVRLREQGKVRFLGVATDAPNLELVAHGALESDRFDVLTLAHHPGAWPELPERIARAAALDVGVLASDPLTGAIGALPDWRPGGSESFAQAALDLVLANPGVASVVVRIGRPEALDELLFVSGRG
ncbi:MAG: aldo/keto reductase [Myxococcota bacterium]